MFLLLVLDILSRVCWTFWEVHIFWNSANRSNYIHKEIKNRLNSGSTIFWAGTAQSVYRVATGRMAGALCTSGVEIIRTHPDLPWGPPSLLYNGYWVFPRGKAAGAWRWSPTSSSAEVRERVELYLYSPSGPSWPVLGWPLPLLLTGLLLKMKQFLSNICDDAESKKPSSQKGHWWDINVSILALRVSF
jgi:hypothetical protein